MTSIGPRMTPLIGTEKFSRLKEDYKNSRPQLESIEEEQSSSSHLKDSTIENNIYSKNEEI